MSPAYVCACVQWITFMAAIKEGNFHPSIVQQPVYVSYPAGYRLERAADKLDCAARMINCHSSPGWRAAQTLTCCVRRRRRRRVGRKRRKVVTAPFVLMVGQIFGNDAENGSSIMVTQMDASFTGEKLIGSILLAQQHLSYSRSHSTHGTNNRIFIHEQPVDK